MDIALPLINTILNTSEDLIIVLDEFGNIINMNNAWKKIETVNEFVPLIIENSNFTNLLESTHSYEQLDSIQQILRGESDEFQKEFTSFIEQNHYYYLFRTYKLTLSSNRIGAIIIYSVYKKQEII